MARDDEEPRRTAATVLGEDLSSLSVADLEARIEAARAEIARIEAELARRGQARTAADAVFRRS